MPPFLLGGSHGDARMGISRLFGLCSALLFASSVTAANIIDLGPSDYKNWGTGTFQHHPNGINAKFGQTVRMPPLNGNLTVTRNPVVPYGSILNGAKNLVRVNPGSLAASAAITAIFLGLDWVFDEELDSWAKEAFDTAVPSDDFYWCGRQLANQCTADLRFPSPEGAAAPMVAEWAASQSFISGAQLQSCAMQSQTVFLCDFTYTRNDGGAGGTQQMPVYRRGSSTCPEGTGYIPDLGICSGVLMVPVTGADVDSINLPALPASDVGSAANDLMERQGAPLPGYTDFEIEGPASTTGPESTTTTTTEAGDSIVTSTTTTTNYNYGDTTITTTNTTTSTTYTNGSHTSTETTTETPGELPVDGGGSLPPAGEWPGFCDWASVVCDWLNWTQEEPPPDVDLPQVIDDDFFNEKTISFGAKSCPPDHQIDLAPFLQSTVGVSFQPLCDFAGLIYYMVMAASYIIAAYISIGVARNG